MTFLRVLGGFDTAWMRVSKAIYHPTHVLLLKNNYLLLEQALLENSGSGKITELGRSGPFGREWEMLQGSSFSC